MMRKILFLFAALVFANVLPAQNDSRLHVRKLELVPNDTEASRAGKKDKNGEKCALVKIQTPNMDEAERNRLVIEADRGTFVYPEPAVGELKVFLTEGVKILVVRHPDYGVLNYDVKERVEGNKVYKMVIEADKPSSAPAGRLSISSNWVAVKMQPSDAVVEIDGKFCANGKAMLSTGEPHSLVATRRYYHPFEATIRASSEEKMEYVFEMSPAFGWLNITSKPENGATVLIDNRRVGVTPYRSDTLASGEYEVTLLKDMYESVTKTVSVRDNNVGSIDIPMKAAFAEIKIATDGESSIYIDGVERGKGIWTGRLGEGEHIVEARKASHRSSMKRIDVTAGRNESITVAAPTPIYGALNINTSPDEAAVYLDGTRIGETPIIKTDVLVGERSLRFEKAGCAPLTKTVTVSENQMLDVSEKLVSGKEVSISTDGKGDKIYVDGVYIGSSPASPTLGFGRHEVKAVRDGKESKQTITVSPNGGATSVQLTFSVGAGNGVFSVSTGKKVHFSKGNLQYQASTDTWRFAENQWDCMGKDNSNISPSYSGWIDLFGWGTGDSPTKSSTNSSDYGSFSDWGNNKISNGGGRTWRTLTRDEWAYVFDARNTTSGIRYAKAQVNGVNGVILLPDDWSSETYNLKNTNTSGASFSGNQISATDWISKLEANGAVFLPAAGWRYGTNVYFVGSYGYYWSATYYFSGGAYYVYFYDSGLDAEGWGYRLRSECAPRLSCRELIPCVWQGGGRGQLVVGGV